MHADTSTVTWEPQTGFHDALYGWMSRAPWLAVSATAHVILFLVLMAIPWELLRPDRPTVIVTSIETPHENLFDDPPPEEPERIEDVLPEEPVLVDSALPESELPRMDEQPSTERDFLRQPYPDELPGWEVIGIGPGGSKFGGRFGGPERGGRGGRGTEPSLRAGLDWLARHQSPDGAWDCDGFAAQCGKLGATPCDGPGEALHDVGMTGLALLAFLGDGNTTRVGRYREVVARGIAWLRKQQDPDTGLLGERIGHGFLYDHAIATLALCEAYYFSKSPLIEPAAQKAVNLITRARNPYSAWRYDYPAAGENDTSVTGWMIFALKSAEDGGLDVDPQAYAGALSWLDEVTDPVTGRVGYASIGSPSSRVAGVNEDFPTDAGEAMTAVGLLCRVFMDQDPEEHPILVKHAELLLSKLPEWDPDGLGNDLYYWYYGSYAMYQMGGSRFWTPWNRALKRAVVDSQRTDGDAQGSWDPHCAWGFAGGRVYSTALMVLCLEVYFRYGQVLGAR